MKIIWSFWVFFFICILFIRNEYFFYGNRGLKLFLDLVILFCLEGYGGYIIFWGKCVLLKLFIYGMLGFKCM